MIFRGSTAFYDDLYSSLCLEYREGCKLLEEGAESRMKRSAMREGMGSVKRSWEAERGRRVLLYEADGKGAAVGRTN